MTVEHGPSESARAICQPKSRRDRRRLATRRFEAGAGHGLENAARSETDPRALVHRLAGSGGPTCIPSAGLRRTHVRLMPGGFARCMARTMRARDHGVVRAAGCIITRLTSEA